MDYLELFVDAFEAIIHFSFLIIILSQKSENVICWWIKFTGCVLVYTCVSYFIISKYDLFIGEEVLLIIMLYAASEFLCRGYRFQKLSFCLLSCIITTISSLITSIVVPILLESPVSDVLQQDGSQVRLVALAFAKTTQILLSLIVILIIKSAKIETEKDFWIPLAFMLFVSEAVVNLMSSNYRVEDEKTKDIIFVLAMILSIVESIIVFLFFMKIIRAERERIRLDAFIDQVNNEVNSVSENEKSLYEVRMLRHEMRNQYIILKELINKEEYEEAAKRISQIIGEAEDSFSRLNVFDSGSPVLNAVLSYYIRKFQNIKVEVNLNIEKITMTKKNEEALCAILMNLLKNAYEAERPEEGSGVKISIKSEMNYIKITVKNKLKSSVLNNGNVLSTTKKDFKNHGFGIKAIKRVIKAREGEFAVYESDGWFVAEAWLSKSEDAKTT